jgi:hypothetical protein
MKNRHRNTVILLVGAFVIFFAIQILPNLMKGPVEPEPIKLEMAGGDPTFGVSNQAMVEFNRQNGYKIDVVTEGDLTGYPNADLVQGYPTTVDQLRAKGIEVLAEMVMSSTPNMIWMKQNEVQDHVTPLINAGWITVQIIDGQKVHTMSSEHLKILLEAAVNEQTYGEIGITDPSVANDMVVAGFANSTGGRTSAAQLLSCMTDRPCTTMLSPTEYQADPKYKFALQKMFTRSGKQTASDYSVDYCKTWLTPKQSAVNISAFPESCYGAWWTSWSESKKDTALAVGNVGIYLERTVDVVFGIYAISDAGVEYIEFLKNNEEFYRVLVDSTGMRGAGDIDIAPTSMGPFISPKRVWRLMPLPFSDLMNQIKADLIELGR